MRVLFDQSTPLPIRSFLRGHVVRTAAEQGWGDLSNGQLLAAAEAAGFDVFLTTDKNIPFQQNVREYRLAIVVIDRQQWPDVRAHVGLVVAAVACAKGGCIHIVHIPV